MPATGVLLYDHPGAARIAEHRAAVGHFVPGSAVATRHRPARVAPVDCAASSEELRRSRPRAGRALAQGRRCRR